MGLAGIERWFGIRSAGSTWGREVLAGLTTFFTVSYIIVVNPQILAAAGIPVGPSLVATALTAAFGTLAMGLFARRPFAVAPYMGENAFIAYTVVGALGFSWQVALGGIFWAGVLFVILTLTGWRRWLADSIPMGLKCAFAVGIGLFLVFLGLIEAGFVKLGVEGAPVHAGNLREPTVWLAALGFFLIIILQIRKVPAALILGILAIAGIGFLARLQPPPKSLVSVPPDLSPIFLQLDFFAPWQPAFLSILFTIFILDFLDTVGTLYGLGHKAGILDREGRFPEVEKPMMCDAAATVTASLLGTTTSGVYIESASGIGAGGRTGMVAVVCGLLFLVALFFVPLVEAIPAFAYAPVLVVVGFTMTTAIKHIALDDLTELVPAMLTVALMCFTFNIGIGITAGLASYPVVKVAGGRGREVNAGTWILAALSVIFFALYPW